MSKGGDSSWNAEEMDVNKYIAEFKLEYKGRFNRNTAEKDINQPELRLKQIG